jgi:hypothetical protein
LSIPDPLWIAFAGMVLISAASWEWGRLNQLGQFSATRYGFVLRRDVRFGLVVSVASITLIAFFGCA